MASTIRAWIYILHNKDKVSADIANFARWIPCAPGLMENGTHNQDFVSFPMTLIINLCGTATLQVVLIINYETNKQTKKKQRKDRRKPHVPTQYRSYSGKDRSESLNQKKNKSWIKHSQVGINAKCWYDWSFSKIWNCLYVTLLIFLRKVLDLHSSFKIAIQQNITRPYNFFEKNTIFVMLKITILLFLT